MATEDRRYWFPAKRYGWGWGIPCTWEGWMVILVFVAIVAIVAIAGRDEVWQLPVIVLATIALLVIGLKKGEPTRWRWGGDK